MYTHCNVCEIEFRPEDVVVACEGLCDDRRQFHAKCVGLSYDEGCACLHANIFWMCDCCRDLIEKGRFRNAIKKETNYATQEELDCLKVDIERISTIISQMTSNCSAEPSTSKERRMESERFVDEHNSPLSSTKISATDHIVDNRDDDEIQLYISNIANDVTEQEVKAMVCKSIGVSDVRSIKPLVPAWKDTSTLDYVSFKIVVDAHFHKSALKYSN